MKKIILSLFCLVALFTSVEAALSEYSSGRTRHVTITDSIPLSSSVQYIIRNVADFETLRFSLTESSANVPTINLQYVDDQLNVVGGGVVDTEYETQLKFGPHALITIDNNNINSVNITANILMTIDSQIQNDYQSNSTEVTVSGKTYNSNQVLGGLVEFQISPKSSHIIQVDGITIKQSDIDTLNSFGQIQPVLFTNNPTTSTLSDGATLNIGVEDIPSAIFIEFGTELSIETDKYIYFDLSDNDLMLSLNQSVYLALMANGDITQTATNNMTIAIRYREINQ